MSTSAPSPAAPPADHPHLRVERDGHVGIITLDRPRVLNAFNDDLVRALRAAVVALDEDDDVWVVVLRGAGRAFSSGADVRERQLRPEAELRAYGGPEAPDAKAHDVLQGLTHWKPMIAAVHGYAIGMALGFVLECEIAVVEAGTRLQVTETARGLGGARYAGLLRHRGGGAWADEVAITGRWFDAEEAHRHGVVNELVPAGRAYPRAMEIAAAIAAHPPLGVRPTVAMRRAEIHAMAEVAYAHIDRWDLHLTEDFRESATAFTEKRPARPYVGR
ncbi:enoyl-CoA hydratase/isomerase family protein [Patulibacter sp. NPDC049589]|uniref:enoyl-CoA hydratase/isomerase family protein n=1 Tax=Patulibacter sp. NPDC049589 TaxID=3154731 RepID=UPI0034491948